MAQSGLTQCSSLLAHRDLGLLTQGKPLLGAKGWPRRLKSTTHGQRAEAALTQSPGMLELAESPRGCSHFSRWETRGSPTAPGAASPRATFPPFLPWFPAPLGAFGALVPMAQHGSKAKPCKTPVTQRQSGRDGLQATSYSLRAGNSASFYQTPHQSFYISPPSAGSVQTLHPLPGFRTPCASCSAPV